MELKVRTVIIDDERTNILTLKNLLDKYFPGIELVSTASNVAEGIKAIDTHHPDLIFLDISMPDGDGFDLLSRVEFRSFEVIFITAHNQYALKAFDYSALHYLLKPIEYTELRKAINRYHEVKFKDSINTRISVLKDNLEHQYKKIIVPSLEGLNIVLIDDIIRLEASDTYTEFYLTKDRKLVASKPLNNFEKILLDQDFIRIHAKHLVNLKYVQRYIKGKGGSVVLDNGEEIDVSVRKKNDFINSLKAYAKSI
ncbi:MAG: LytTR family DNA-binding domain-containing protein [Bacteroidales bacterium]|nr:LytTR family DNA-binding domain-containing protein [Bacteroidales bacterium]